MAEHKVTEPTPNWAREQHYLEQAYVATGAVAVALTPRQQRRMRHKANRALREDKD